MPAAEATASLTGVLSRIVARVRGAAAVEPVESGPIPQKRIARPHIGKGYVDPGNRPGMKRIVVTVEEKTFARIRARAVKSETSFASVVRDLIERGFSAEDRQ